jgi:alkylated DNA repair dioxygenase AlkB
MTDRVKKQEYCPDCFIRDDRFMEHCNVWTCRDFFDNKSMVDIKNYEALDLTVRQVFVYGKWHDTPRRQVGYGDKGTYYTFSGSRTVAKPWTKFLKKVKAYVEAKTDREFNFVLINHYLPNGSDNIGWHSDSEPEMVGDVVSITVCSKEEGRDFDFRMVMDKKFKIRTRLYNNTCIIFDDQTNMEYQHSIPKRSKGKEGGTRINMTWRMIQN